MSKSWRGLALAMVVFSPVAEAKELVEPWSATLYAGPAVNRWVTTILGGNIKPNGAMLGLALDGRIARLTSKLSLAGEVQFTQFAFGVNYSTVSGGIGVRYDGSTWGVPTTFAIYTGPSYASASPLIYPYGGKMPRFVNYVGFEAGATLLNSKYDVVVRMFHRSGAWGLYSTSADEGSMIGVGLRRRF